MQSDAASVPEEEGLEVLGVSDFQDRRGCASFMRFGASSCFLEANGEPGGNRTLDHMIKSHVLYP